MQRSTKEVRVSRIAAPDLARQVQALLRLLEHTNPSSEMPQPQDRSNPGAATCATVSSGHNLWSTQLNDTRIDPHSK